MSYGVPAEVALDLWSDFPVDRTPRPLVGLAGRDIVDPLYGFRDSVLKCAYCDGAFERPATFPAGPPTAGGYPIISAEDAFAALIAAGDGQGSETTLAVTDMRLTTSTFDTDRGARLLPAWLISLRDVQNPAAVLAVARSARFLPDGIVDLHRVGVARMSADEMTLTVAFVGGPPESHEYEYAAHVLESRTAVAVTVQTTRLPTGRHHLVGYAREANVTLRSPLGARVVVDGSCGAPRPVAT
jgi:hypothetical protein